ncbi:MAG: replicative DNA helicase [Planctomycetes bacterium]|nr:replicative DNA helicase [Planctomycetota bacterium]
MATETIAGGAVRPFGLDYQQPYDPEAETALLGALILNNEPLGDIAEIIKPRSFYDTRHHLIFETMLSLYDRRQPFDAVTLKDELLKKGYLDKIGGVEAIMALAESVPTTSNALYYANIIREKYVLREITNVCNEILRKASEGKSDSDRLLDEAERMILDIAQQKEMGESRDIKGILKIVSDQIDEFMKRKGGVTGLATGLTVLDRMIGGMQPSQFIIVAGRPSMGKSSFALLLLEQIGLVQQKPVALFTLEDTANQVVQRLICMHSRIKSTDLRGGFISEEEHSRILLACGAFNETKIFIDDTSGLSVFELRNRVRRLKSQHDIQLVIIDYLQLMRWEDASNREREIAYISSSIKGLAKELKIPIVALAQLSRETERRATALKVDTTEPRISDLRESGALEQDADVILLLHRNIYRTKTEDESGESKEDNTCKLIIGKQRNGPTGPFKVAFLREYFRFDNLAGETSEE